MLRSCILQPCCPARGRHTPRSQLETVHCSTKQPSVAVVGGGAAGLTAAYFAAQSGAQERPVRKSSYQAAQDGAIVSSSSASELRVIRRYALPSVGLKPPTSSSNVLPMDIDIQRDFVTESSKSAVKAVFASWSLGSCKAWLEDDVNLKLAFETGSSKYFPQSNSAKEVRDKLVAACTRLGVTFQYSASLRSLGRGQGTWCSSLACGQTHQSDRVVMATGGMSFPALGTDGTGMHVLETMGHTLHQPYPALTPLKGTHVANLQLAGLSLYSAQLQCKKPGGAAKKRKRQGLTAERRALLMTHRGFSGPAVLDLSHHLVRSWERKQDVPAITANWVSEDAPVWEQRFRQAGSSTVTSLLRQHGLPARLAEALAEEAGVKHKQVAQLKKEEARTLLTSLVEYPLACTGHEGYPKAEVTGGGVQLEDVDCATLESRLHPGLHICGELLDVFGRIGGYNFYWAWLTGRQAGLAAARA